ncbi:MAG: hypothetical protein VKJ85_01510, partial [Prochlorothrix sp.]|nr:hypothetical protein [Prochlorothrix sp.]
PVRHTINCRIQAQTMTPLSPLPGAISDLFAQVCSTHELTLADRYGLQAALLNPVSDEELRCIDRIFYLVRRGRVQLSPELSIVR